MGKHKDGNPLDALDARIRALEAHNGWTPGACPPPDYIGTPTDGEPTTSDEPLTDEKLGDDVTEEK